MLSFNEIAYFQLKNPFHSNKKFLIFTIKLDYCLFIKKKSYALYFHHPKTGMPRKDS